MSIWIILSWVFVLILTAVNIVIFLQLKKASEQMMKMAFPGAKNMNDAVASMQAMMGQRRGAGSPRAGQGRDAQLKAAMEMLKKSQKK